MRKRNLVSQYENYDKPICQVQTLKTKIDIQHK